MEITSSFPSLEAMERLMAMGMDEGMREAVGQVDDLLG
jgi:Fe2+ transport system protein FeoA